MRTGYAVIGANYGDEGKGLITDYLASRDPDRCLVVRYNGGAQAGHTVVSPDGRRHVFSHFGAGSFVGSPTFLSRFFIVNPILFAREYKVLGDIGIAPQIFIDSKAFATTPCDMFINQFLESLRGKGRHGSCGVGINETVTRCLRSDSLRTEVVEFLNPSALFGKLMKLGTSWLPERLKEYGIDPDTPEVNGFVAALDRINSQYICDVRRLLDVASITREYPRGNRVIFEGAQGLMLDQDRLDLWPHLTRSSTGLTNVLYLASRFGLDRLEATYVSRTYLTRHGAGPLPGEADWSFPDNTNVRNQFQGTLRFAPLDFEQLRSTIELDLIRAKHGRSDIIANLAITCNDQSPLSTRADLCLPIKFVSFGPTREEVRQGVLATVSLR